ncbi:hypothetical protein [Polyangium sorediatum]|uniref:Uncharacterized protein n=1 Tax=Polyangium sorediatum TaxID=889274 RepID=A0ABT6NP25_9BACT|nr:hypothetical protein [Polyangium sorediatum]MDI1430021.1 hypothetical protein [Polyangium sorediatum]
MQSSKVVEALELAVPAADGEELLFRLEVLAHGAGNARRYRCRLYRLESFRFRVLGSKSGGRGRKWDGADYRCWVVDDSLGVDLLSYPSIAKARNAAVLSLKTQLGLQ